MVLPALLLLTLNLVLYAGVSAADRESLDAVGIEAPKVASVVHEQAGSALPSIVATPESQYFWSAADNEFLDPENAVLKKLGEYDKPKSLSTLDKAEFLIAADVAKGTPEQIDSAMHLYSLFRNNTNAERILQRLLLTDVVVPQGIQQALVLLQDVKFPSRVHFERAVCQFESYLRNPVPGNATEAEVERALENAGFNPDAWMRGAPDTCATQDSAYVSKLATLAEKRLGEYQKEVTFAEPDCDCNSGRATTTTYGLFPFWRTATDEDPQIKPVAVLPEDKESSDAVAVSELSFDYSLYDRIEYLRATLRTDSPDEPALKDETKIARENRERFMARSSIYQNKVDMLLHLRSRTPFEFALGNQAAIVDELVAASSEYDGITLWVPTVEDPCRWSKTVHESRQKDSRSCLESHPDNGETSEADKPKIDVYYERLAALLDQLRTKLDSPANATSGFNLGESAEADSTALDKAGKTQEEIDLVDQIVARIEQGRPRLNLMMTGSVEGATTTISHLRRMLERDRGESATTVDDVLLFVPESTSKQKKALRKIVESEFSGFERRTVMRKLVPLTVSKPILPGKNPRDYPSDAAKNQMFHDLQYYEDNFGGAGTWGLLETVTENGSPDPMALLINEVFERPPGRFGICAWVCPEKEFWKLVLGGFSLLLVLLAGSRVLSCKIRGSLSNVWLNRILAILTVLLLIAWCLLLGCVPTRG